MDNYPPSARYTHSRSPAGTHPACSASTLVGEVRVMMATKTNSPAAEDQPCSNYLSAFLACTVCVAGPSGSGENPTREAIFNSSFFPNLALMLLPFVVLVGAVLLVHFAFPEPPPARQEQSA